MSILENDFKEKSKRRGRQFPVDFVVPLQLEACIYRIEHFASTVSLQIAITNPHAIPVKVYFNCDLDSQVSVSGEGMLKRWEGTSTRFAGEVKIPNPLSPAWEVFLLFILPVIALLFGIMVHMFIELLVPAVKAFNWHHPLFYTFVGAVCGMWVLVRRMYNRRLMQVKNALIESLLRDN